MESGKDPKWVLAVVAILACLIGAAGMAMFGNKAPTDSASKVYVPPGKYDEFYAFMSGGFSGQVTVHGLPSGRLFRTIPVFSVNAENGYGFTEESKPMLNTSHGFVPWDDSHHPQLSQTKGVPDGRWLFINANNTPRIARIDLETFETEEIIEIPNSAGNHASPFVTENSEYVVASTRFSVPIPQKDVPIDSYKKNFKGTITFIKVDQDGEMAIDFQIVVPGYNYDLAIAGKGKSHGWSFFSCYNSEQANTILEANASKKDKDFIAAVNWARVKEFMPKAKEVETLYYHNVLDKSSHIASSYKMTKVKVLDPKDCPGLIYYLPTPKSPHGVDVDPSGEYIVGGGKLSQAIPVHSFSKMLKAIESKAFEKEIDGIPVLKYESVIFGEVDNPGLGPLHTQFDGKGYAYTSNFISSNVVKWEVETLKIVDKIDVYYSIGHLMIPGGDSGKPWGKYLVALNKVTKNRYLPTGPELCHSAQLIDISGDKMKILLDFPTMGEPHYAQGIDAELVAKKSKKFYELDKNTHPHAVTREEQTRVERKGKDVHVYMTTIKTHFMPDNIEGIKVGDQVFFHVTNLEQSWDVPHGFAVQGANNAELLIMPGETKTLKWMPKKIGVYTFYCTDFCSPLHQEMQGYLRVSPSDSNIELKWNKPEKK